MKNDKTKTTQHSETLILLQGLPSEIAVHQAEIAVLPAVDLLLLVQTKNLTKVVVHWAKHLSLPVKAKVHRAGIAVLLEENAVH